MKIFLDTADVNEIRTLYISNPGMIDGVTTNPTLMLREGRDPYQVYQEIKDIGIEDISMEVVGNAEEMYTQGLELVEAFGDVATIKVPCTEDGLWACKMLADKGIRVNVTLIFCAAQAILAAKAGAAYVSPFIGRCDDNSVAGAEVVRSIAGLYQVQGIKTQVLAASIRDVYKVTRAFYNGASIVTMPPKIFRKMYKHILTDDGVAKFNWDYVQSKM